jgi:hypothetical protein
MASIWYFVGIARGTAPSALACPSRASNQIRPRMKTRQRVLSDHKQRGKILIPPFTHMLGPMAEISWIKTILPELLWIGLIHNSHGDRRAVEIITLFTRLARSIKADSTNKWFAAMSDYTSLSSADYEQLRGALQQQEALTAILAPLKPLISWYPECPLARLFPEPPQRSLRKSSLAPLKEIIASLYPRSERGPMMVQATATWLAFDANILKVTSDLSLARFPEIEHYPDTDISQKIGSSIRGGLNVFFGSKIHYSDDTWPDYFWNRGLAIEPCELSQ